jgi:hypothetical protein
MVYFFGRFFFSHAPDSGWIAAEMQLAAFRKWGGTCLTPASIRAGRRPDTQ